jgi:hypothetical protein
MIDFKHRRLFRWSLLLSFVVVFAFARSVEAELVELTDGRFHAGHIIEETPTQLRLTTGDAAGSHAITLPRNTIRQVYRDLDEAQQIGQCTDEDQLRQWAAAYFHADLAANATQCVERLFKIAPRVGDAPLKRGAKPFLAFWNRAVLRQRILPITKPDVRDHVELARWAWAADLRDEAAYHLRQGWCKKRDSASVMKYAKTWDVTLESWVRPDLRPSMETSLFTDAIVDDRSTVTARPGTQFLQIPLRYDATRGDRLLSKSVVRGKERRSYYGIRVSDRAPGRSGLETDRNPVIHERVELASKPGVGPQLTLKNNLGPREAGEEDAPRQRLRTPSQTVRPSGWAVLVLEVPQRDKTITLHWDDGGFETIRLDYLRESVGAMLDPKLRAPESRMIGEAIAQLERPSASMAELAVIQLAWLRQQISPNGLAAWTSRVEPAVLKVATRVERHLKIAAWDYFSQMESSSPAALRALGGMDNAVHLAWIEVFREQVFAAEGDVPAMTVPMLTAILRSKDQAVCGAAIERLLKLGPDVDWRLIGTASETAQLAALDRVHLLKGPQAARMLTTLMKAVRKTSADKIARYAESIQMHLTDPRDPVLSQWRHLEDSDERCALLTILESVDLGDLVYSRPIGDIIRESLDAGCDPAVREAMFSFVVGQMRRRLKVLQEPGGGLHGFPVLVDAKSRDPILMALTEAAARSAPPLRDEALSVLLALGYAQAAEVALLATIEKPGDLDERIKALIGREEIARSDGLLAMFGRLLDEKHESSARRILSHLSSVVAPADVSRWRVYAALKAGVDLKELAALTVSRHPLITGPAERWLFALGHLTPQDRERFTAPMDARQRIERLERIDARRARLVAGEYGAIAIVETTLFCEEALHEDDELLAGSMMRWRVPRRSTLTLPPMTFRMEASTDTYGVFCEGKQIGRGTIRITAPPRGLLDPASFSIRLADAKPQWLGRDGWGWPSPVDFGRPEESAIGSVMLGSRPVRNTPTPGTMTLDVTDLLRAALPDVDLATSDKPEIVDPRRCRITLRYAAFASYYGVGTTRPLPMDRRVTGKLHLINFMLVLEKLDS